jgi:hypothetical protein
MKLFTLEPKVNRSGEFGPGGNGFRYSGQRRSGEPPRYNPRKQREISASRASGERVVLGGWRRKGDCGLTVSEAQVIAFIGSLPLTETFLTAIDYLWREMERDGLPAFTWRRYQTRIRTRATAPRLLSRSGA